MFPIPSKTQIIAIGLALILAFGAGWKVHSWKTDAAEFEKVAQAEKRAKEFETKANELEDAYLKVAAQLGQNKVETIRYVPKIITVKDDAACVINRGAIRLYNNSLQGRVTSPEFADDTPSGVALSTLGSTYAENNITCAAEMTRFKTLQDTIRAYVKIQGEQ